MRKYSIVLFIPVLVFLSSCSTYKYTSRVANIQTDNNVSIGSNVVDVKVDYSKKITAISDMHNSVETARENAYYKAIQENKIDILVSPIYVIETESSGKNSKATVTGYAGYFVNSRSTAEEQKNQFNTKVDALGKLLKLDPVVAEKQTTVILGTQTTEKDKSVTTITGPSSSIIEKFDMLYNDGLPKEAPVVTPTTPQNLTVTPKLEMTPSYNQPKQIVSAKPKMKSPFGATLMSFVLPGWGQYYNGQTGKGLLMTGIHLASYAIFVIAGTNPVETKIWNSSTRTYTYDYNTSPLVPISMGIIAVNGIWSMIDAGSNAKSINLKKRLSWNLSKKGDLNLALLPDCRTLNFGNGKLNPVVGASLSLNIY